MPNSAQVKPTTIEAFVDSILRERSIDHLQPAVQRQLRTNLINRVNQRINREIVSQLPAQQQQELDRLIEVGNQQSAQQFIADNVNNVADIVTAVLVAFKSEYLDGSSE